MGQMTGKLNLPMLACCLVGALTVAQGSAQGTIAAPSAQTRPAQIQIEFPTSAPASVADSPQARRLKLILASRVKLLVTVNESSQARAKAVLLTLQQACLDTLTELFDDKDPEVRQAAIDILAKYSLEGRVARTMAMLEPAQSQMLRDLRGKYPALVAQLLGDNMAARIAALKKLVSMKDQGHLAEPLLAMCLWHSYRPLRTAAAEIIADKEYGSDDIIDAITDLVVEGIRRGPYYSGGGGVNGAESFATQALYRLHPQQAAGKVFAAMREARYNLTQARVDLLVQLDEKRLIPVLLADLQSVRSTTTLESAWMFDVLLRLTNQSLSDYGIRRDNLNPMMSVYGAYQVENWGKAASKLAEWWKANKDTPAYRNLKPLPIPQLPAMTAPDDESFGAMDNGDEPLDDEADAATVIQLPREGPDSGNAPSPTTATAPSADTALYDTAGLETQIRRLVASCAEGLRSERPKERMRAREAILAIEQSILDAIVQAKHESQAHVMPMLTALAVRCEMAARLRGMSEWDRHQFVQYAQHHAQIVEEFFSPVWNQQKQAVAKMQAQMDPAAEPLVVLALKHPWSAVRDRAIAMTAGMDKDKLSPYHGDAVVDTLCDLLAARLAAAPSNVRFFGRARMFRANNSGEYANEQNIMRALRQLKSKRSAPVLLAMMVTRREPGFYQADIYNNAALAQTLADTGEVRAIPMLCELLQRPDTRVGSTRVNNKVWSFSDGDTILYALLLLTGQAPQDYKMMVGDQGQGQLMIGFSTPEARRAAVDQFRLWWREHQDRSPYKDIIPLAVPISNPGNSGYRLGM